MKSLGRERECCVGTKFGAVGFRLGILLNDLGEAGTKARAVGFKSSV